MNVTYNPKEMKKRFFAPVTHPAPGRRTAGGPVVKKQAPGSQKPAITPEEYTAAMTSLNQAQDDASAEKFFNNLKMANPALIFPR